MTVGNTSLQIHVPTQRLRVLQAAERSDKEILLPYARQSNRRRGLQAPQLRVLPMVTGHFTAACLQRGATHLCKFGPRATAELLPEVGNCIGGMPCILGLLTEFERIIPEMLFVIGGDKFPLRLRVVLQ